MAMECITQGQVESYSLNEIIDLRLGSTLYQVSEGLAYLISYWKKVRI